MFDCKPVNVGLIGAGRIGSSHGEIVTHHLIDARLVAVCDPTLDAAQKLASRLGVFDVYANSAALLARADINAVIVATPPQFHADLTVAALEAGKHVFCEKPMALTLEDADRVHAAAQKAGKILQIGFNRRWDSSFAQAKDAIVANKVGTPQLLRSLTRDPAPFKRGPERVVPWTIFYETLIHDFDTLLWLNEGAKPIEVHSFAGALVFPEFKNIGFLDTAVVTIHFDNGAIAVAEANFSATYGYDIRGEVFGSLGMVTMGDVRRSSMTLFDEKGVSYDTYRLDTDLFIQGYISQLARFIHSARTGEEVLVPRAQDARNALEIALAAIQSVAQKKTVSLV